MRYTAYATIGDTQLMIENASFFIVISVIENTASLCRIPLKECSYSIVATDNKGNEQTIVDYAG